MYSKSSKRLVTELGMIGDGYTDKSLTLKMKIDRLDS